MATKVDTAPERTCAGCGQAFWQDSLVRLALGPDRQVELDYQRRLPGRGAYLFPNRACFFKPEAKRGLARAFKDGQFSFEPERLWETLVRVNRTRLSEDLRLALKAGAVVSGGNTIELELAKGAFKLLWLADDASANTLDRVQGWARRLEAPLVQALTQEELGHQLGKEARVVIAIREDAFAQKIRRDAAIYDAIMNRSACHFTR